MAGCHGKNSKGGFYPMMDRIFIHSKTKSHGKMAKVVFIQ
jgi:hypothetical protein